MTISRPELVGDLGAVSATHWLAAATAMSILERRGNAFDAAVAAGFVLQVVEPHSNGLGGDASIVLYSAKSRTVKVICGQGPMPAAATIEYFRSQGLRQIPGSGLLPASVPGAFGAWLRLLAEFGTMRLSTVLSPAIGYAGGGYPLLPGAAQVIAQLAPLFETQWHESARTYLPDGTPPPAGSRLRNPALAEVFRRILREARAAASDRQAQIEAAHSAFYQGFVAEGIDKFIRNTEVLDATGRARYGLLTAEDMYQWRPTVEEPARLDYGEHTVCKPGPWSQGPVFLQQLALLGGFDLGAMQLGGAEYIHTVMESAKLAFADREAWYGDPRHTSVPLGRLLSPTYTAARRRLIGDHADADPGPGTAGRRRPFMPSPEPDEPAPSDVAWMAQLRSGMPNVVAATARSGDTCTVVVADRRGNLVAAVPSGGWLKSSPVIPGLGLSLGTRGQTMWLTEGHPNSLAPGRRPRTTLSPTVVLRDGAPYLAFGTPGGDQQDQWTLEAFLAVVVFGLDLQAAVEATAFHTDHFPASFAPRTARPAVVVLERSADPATVATLRERGHVVDLVPESSLGKVCMVGVDPARGFVRAGAGPRGRQAYAACR